jgi:pentatricopeptide repeat protein
VCCNTFIIIQASLGLLRAVPPAWGVGARGHSIAISACARAGQGQEACDLLHNFYAATGERPDLQTCATVMGKCVLVKLSCICGTV